MPVETTDVVIGRVFQAQIWGVKYFEDIAISRASQVWDGVFFSGNLQIERKQRENQAGISKHRTIWDSNLLKQRTLLTSLQLCSDFELIHLQNHAKSRSKKNLIYVSPL